jgi:succinate dehydrogenase flavin-adding protein (antitoxin of CptAB toxin-antitoxin module)
MAVLKIKWNAKGKGTLEIPLEDLDMNLEEWDQMSDEDQEQLAIDLICQDDETIVYGQLKSFELVDEDY